MTENCRITYIRDLQCKYGSLVKTIMDKLALGRDCKELQETMLVVQEYIESLYGYTVYPDYVNEYTIDITVDAISFGLSYVEFDIVTDTQTITVNHTFSPALGAPVESDFVDWLETVFTGLGFTVTRLDVNSILVSTTDTGFENMTLTSPFISTFAGGSPIGNETIYATVTSSSVNTEYENCLTEEEICNIVGHAYKLLNKCNC